MDQMTQPKRVNNNKELLLRLSFGKAKEGYEFVDWNDYNNYIGLDGDACDFSQNDDGHSPFESKFGAVLRESTWKNPGKIAELIQHMYTDDKCKLFYGFTREHANSFYRIIMANLSSFKDASPFISFMSDEITTPSEDIINEKLLTVFNNYHSTDVFGVLPQLNKFPPTNETMCRVPPNYNDWRKTSSSIITPCHSNSNESDRQLVTSVSSNLNVDEIVVLKFLREKNECCVIVQGDLTLNSKMETVMKKGEVLEDLGLETDDFDVDVLGVEDVWHVANCRFIIRTKNSDFSLKWKQFQDMTVYTFTKLKNIHESFSIDIVKKI